MFHLGVFAAHHANMSTIRRSAGSIGKHHACCAMYSLRMSFWTVPWIWLSGTPCFSAAAA